MSDINKTEFSRSEKIALIGNYRDYAKFYYDTRSKLTYLNIIAAGAILFFFSQPLLSRDDYLAFVGRHGYLYLAGGVLMIGISAWSTAISNFLSNALYNYLTMAKELEEELGVDYKALIKWSWAQTFEFLSRPEDISGKVFSLNVWNWLNGSIALLGASLFIGVVSVLIWG